jgi:hypothetical protein
LLEVTGIASYAAGSTLYSSQAGEITCSKVFCLKRQHHENVKDFLQPLAFIEPMSHLSTGCELRHGGKKLNQLLQLAPRIHSLPVARTPVRPVSMVSLSTAKTSKFKYNNEMFKTSLKIAVRGFFILILIKLQVQKYLMYQIVCKY